MKNSFLKNIYAITLLASYASAILLGSSQSESSTEKSALIEALKFGINHQNGLKKGFELIGENFEVFVDEKITEILSDEENANPIDALNKKVIDKIVLKMSPMFVDIIKKTLTSPARDIKPREITIKGYAEPVIEYDNPIIEYVAHYKDFFKTRSEDKYNFTEWGRSGLFIVAIAQGAKWIVKLCINLGVNVNEAIWRIDKDLPHGNNIPAIPLLCAAMSRNHEIIKILLDAGADINKADSTNGTALIITVKHYCSDVQAQILLDAGADVNATDVYNRSALMIASDCGNARIMKTLLNAGANVNQADVYGYTALMLIAQTMNANSMDVAAITKILLAAGANKEAIDRNGRTALMFASSYSRYNMVKLLLNAGADVNQSNEHLLGRPALFDALNDLAMVKILLDAGADITLKNHDGQTVFDCVKKPEVRELLNSYRTWGQFLDHNKYTAIGASVGLAGAGALVYAYGPALTKRYNNMPPTEKPESRTSNNMPSTEQEATTDVSESINKIQQAT